MIIPNPGGPTSTGGWGGTVNVYVAGSVVTERQLQQSLLLALDKARFRRGRGSILDA
jgi:hypothetical protein